MAIVFKTAEQVAQDYLTTLKADKPEVDIAATDGDWWIRAHVTGGVLAGAYSDQRKIGEDAFPQDARREALLKHLFTYFADTAFIAPTQALGPVMFTGTPGSSIPPGQTATYTPTGAIYVFQNLSNDTLAGSSGSETVKSVGVGQSQNLPVGTVLTLNSPPVGIASTVTVLAPGITDGRNEETEEEAAARTLDFIRSGSPGGNKADYEKWARDADPSVVSARALKLYFGFGTTGIVITAGTTDIDAALDAVPPQAVSLVPSSPLVATVQAYVLSKAPESDDPIVMGALTQSIDVSVATRFITGNKDTVVTDPLNPTQTITQGGLVTRELQRAIYKTQVGGSDVVGLTGGYMLAKDLQDALDSRLGYGPAVVGEIAQILVDRTITISGGSPNLAITANKQPIPGTLTVSNL